MTAPDKNEHLDRHHTDAPAEGETEGWVPHDTGLHSQEPHGGSGHRRRRPAVGRFLT